MTDLNPCPFCGGEAIIRVREWDCPNQDDFQPECLVCSCVLDDSFATEEKATEAWNRRKP